MADHYVSFYGKDRFFSFRCYVYADGDVTKRYQDWNNDLGKFIHAKTTSLESIHQKVLDNNIEPKPKSGQQEFLENLINKYL